MKPLVVISHVSCEHPGYLCEYLDKWNIHYEKIRLEQGESVPDISQNLSGLIVLGAPVSVNDPLTWINAEIALIKSAVEKDIPVLGICFGAQLMARALGAEVAPAPGMQIGWHPVILTQQGKKFLGDAGIPDRFLAFEWHGDTFSLPQGAVPLFTGQCIKQQGFLYRDSLALQFHPEITEPMVHEWLDRYAHCLKRPTACIQSRKEILEDIGHRLATQRIVANGLFGWWLDRVRGCSRGIRQQVTRR